MYIIGEENHVRQEKDPGEKRNSLEKGAGLVYGGFPEEKRGGGPKEE